jgi:hypothetical protein
VGSGALGTNRDWKTISISNGHDLCSFAALCLPNLLPGVQGWASMIVNGWEMTGVNSWQNGFPFTVYSGVDNSFTGVGSDRADFMGSNISQANFGDRSHGQMVNQYFHTALLPSTPSAHTATLPATL